METETETVSVEVDLIAHLHVRVTCTPEKAAEYEQWKKRGSHMFPGIPVVSMNLYSDHFEATEPALQKQIMKALRENDEQAVVRAEITTVRKGV